MRSFASDNNGGEVWVQSLKGLKVQETCSFLFNSSTLEPLNVVGNGSLSISSRFRAVKRNTRAPPNYPVGFLNQPSCPCRRESHEHHWHYSSRGGGERHFIHGIHDRIGLYEPYAVRLCQHDGHPVAEPGSPGSDQQPGFVGADEPDRAASGLHPVADHAHRALPAEPDRCGLVADRQDGPGNGRK